MHPVQTKEVVEKSILLSPLVIAFIWMVYSILQVQAPEAGMRLSAGSVDGLVNALFTFIILYSVLLLIIFIKMRGDLKKKVKKSRRRKK